jgi:hypothetical protein
MSKKIFLLLITIGVLLIITQTSAQTIKVYRPPAVPLIACDPYFSVWSISDKLYDNWPRHWTGTIQALVGMVRIDDKTFRIMGKSPDNIPTLTQTNLDVLPTRTIYEFDGEGIHLKLTFMIPLIASDINLVSKPITYIIWDINSIDGKEHSVKIYFDNSAELVVNTSDQKVTWSRYQVGDLSILRMGSQKQPILAKSGDNLRIDWGYLYLVSQKNNSAHNLVTDYNSARSLFVKEGVLSDDDDIRNPRPADDDWPVMAYTFDFGKVTTPVSHYILLAYDDVFSIQYLYRNLRPYWRCKGVEIEELVKNAIKNYPEIAEKCKNFDVELMEDLKKVGGEKYSIIASLAFRQCLAANKIAVDIDGSPMMFPKENFSNGCIATVDVIYPASPLFLFFNTKLLKAQITPLLEYAKTDRWKFPFAPHDLGTYPLANGQVYGGGEKTEDDQMPVEESGNMLLMIAAIAKIEGKADYALKYWEILTKWAEYLKEKGLDPENQLCTDDFAGHLAHNVNLSLKAILALGGYAMLCDMTGKKAEAKTYQNLVKDFTRKWIQMADDGDHYKLAFDKPGTWSQKYNLVWDKILGLNLFPDEVASKEIKYYLTKQNKFGLPLDNRKDYTKADWLVWSATLAQSQSDFDALISPLFDFLNNTPNRVPFTDWYWTKDAKQVGFQARSVVGGVFIKMLTDKDIWKKWVGKSW